MTTETEITRFWSHVEKRSTDECWTWKLSTKNDGYGIFVGEASPADGKRRWKAHRYSYRTSVGPIPEGMFVCHHCDNRACVNPTHLFVGTIHDNNNDKIRKGRQARGAIMGARKLTADEVLEIRRLHTPGRLGCCRLGKMFGVDTSAIHAVVTRFTWDHLPIEDEAARLSANRPQMFDKEQLLKTRGDRCKLTTDQVREIRRLYKPRTFSTYRLAKMFGVNNCTIFGIVTGKLWKHVPLDPESFPNPKPPNSPAD